MVVIIRLHVALIDLLDEALELLSREELLHLEVVVEVGRNQGEGLFFPNFFLELQDVELHAENVLELILTHLDPE